MVTVFFDADTVAHRPTFTSRTARRFYANKNASLDAANYQISGKTTCGRVTFRLGWLLAIHHGCRFELQDHWQAEQLG